MPTYPNGKILVFAKTPERSKVKTRLQPVLGEEGCYQLHKQLVTNTLKTVVRAKIAPIEVWHTGNATHPFWSQLNEQYILSLKQQRGRDLGERMHGAFVDVLNSPVSKVDWTIIIGADCPEIDAAYLANAAAMLESGKSAVVGPAEDGGYVLLGLGHPHSFLFDGIPWGTSSVLEKTLSKAAQNDCDIYQMRSLRDLDNEEDLRYFAGTIALFSDKVH